MKKNGFTLIELLAIIVILAIIAVITVPIILGIIDNSKKGAAKDSAYGYKDSISKFYLDKLIDDDYFILNDVYTVTQLKDMGVRVNGSEPIGNSWVRIEKNILVNGCLQFDEYKVDITDGEVGNAVKGECDMFAANPVAFETDSWATIKKAINEDNTSVYNVGDTKEVVIDNVSYTVRLSNKSFNGCDTVENGFSQTACGFVFEFIDTIGENHVMNIESTNVGGWPASDLFIYLNNDIYNKLPSDLKSVIADTYTVSGHGSTEGEENFESISKLYLLSGQEIFGQNIENDTACDKTKQLKYYEDNVLNSSKIKYTTASTPEANTWWTRVANSGTDEYFKYVYADGKKYDNVATTSNGVAPAFRIVKD